MISEDKPPLIHWNYFLALENDLEKMSRYIEFDVKNNQTYSIELARIFLAASSEVDVMAKMLCSAIHSANNPQNMNQYRQIIMENAPGFASEKVFIPRFNKRFTPWSMFRNNKNPMWWRSHNDVKHQRDRYFAKANLIYTINSVGALLVTIFYFYKQQQNLMYPREVTEFLSPQPTFLRLNESYYYQNLIV